MGQHVEQKWNVGLDAPDAALDEHAPHPRHGLRERPPPRRVLYDHGIEVGRDGESGVSHAVHAYACAGRVTVEGDDSRVGGEVPFGVLGGDAALDGHAAGDDVLLFETDLLEGGATGNADLGLDDVDSGDLFGHGVLDLNPGIDLDKVRSVLLIQQKLHRPRILVLGRARELHGVLVQLRPELVRQAPRRRHLDDLLMPPLDGTIALPEVDDVAPPVPDDLHLDVTRTLHEPLHKAAPVAERRQSLAARRLERRDEIGAIAHDAHALPSPAHGRLDDDGQADLVHEGVHGVVVHERVAPRDHRHAGGDGGLAGGGLVREGVEVFGGGAHEGDARVLARARELRALAEESVPGVDGVDAALPGDVDDLGYVEVGADGGGAVVLLEDVALVRPPAVLSVPILVDVDGHGGHVELGHGALDAHGDLGAVRGHDLLEGRGGRLVGGDLLGRDRDDIIAGVRFGLFHGGGDE
mmetsp:Transcript_21330/g.51566  ORF Transcript_21330/g.51566 Transcript_21330/m.51566 type:complete len:467 (+) Transcript_21330:783-2183(+)